MVRFTLNSVVTAVCTYFITYFGEEKRYLLLTVPVGFLFVQALVNYLISKRESQATGVLLRFLYERANFSSDSNVRVTLLKPNILTKNFKQIARYSISQPQLTNHRFHIHKGVAGKAFREKTSQYMKIEANFHKAIMKELGFTEEEARAFIQKAEYFCVPIFDERKSVKYVLSFDSEIPDTFTDEIRETLLEYIPFVASIIDKAYRDEEVNRIAQFYGVES